VWAFQLHADVVADADTGENAIPKETRDDLSHRDDVESRVTRTTFKPTLTNVKKGNSRDQLPSLNTTNQSLQYGDITGLEDTKHGTGE